MEAINNSLLNKLPGKETIFKSVDSVVDPNSAVQYPTEFLNSLQPPGLPPHNLILKVGAPIMLLRNLDPPRLCNGTRLTVKYILPHVLATILTGPGTNEDIFIQRIPLIPVDMPFEFKRLQFCKVELCDYHQKVARPIFRCSGTLPRISLLLSWPTICW